MASTFKLVFAVPLLLQLLDFCRGGKVGVDYGTDANNLPSPDQVSDLVKKHNIQYLRIYDSDPKVLKSLSNTGIELMVGVHNDDLSKFQFQSYVDSWVKNSILPYYQATKITDISVGVEVTDSPDAANLAVPAMRNVVSALKKVGLQDRIKVSTPLSFGVLSKSYPPSDGAFDGSHDNVLGPLLDFLEENQSPFMVNLYPFYAIGDSSLDAVLFKSPSSIFVDPNTGFSYKNIFDAQLDAVHFALAKRKSRSIPIIVTETGWPTRGSGRHRLAMASLDNDDDSYASIDNAQTYNTNLIRHVTDGSGTPARPDEELVVYIFSLFNENLKQGPETERNFGLFYPDMRSVYNLVFPGKGTGRSWCVASSQASNSALQNALDWACGPGKADCSALQPDQQCFQPNNLVSHASFAFNNYYQKNGLTDQACRFGGTGIVVYNDPSYGNCIYNVKSRDPNGRTWCVASSQASRSNLQNALDWACGPGKADCSEIQPNQKCFQPDTLLAHASFAFNNYYQKNGATDASCSFRGNAIKVDQDPSNGNCVYHYFCRGSKVGVAYGRNANNLPQPDQVAQLVEKQNIQYLRIYDSDPKVFKAFSNTSIELMVGVRNADLSAFQSQSYVDSWLRNSILPYYPATNITHITVGVEMVDSLDDATNLVVLAMRNVVSALKIANLQDRIKVSTPLSSAVLSTSNPPSEGVFSSSYENVLRPLLDFLEENQSPFMVDLYPFYAMNNRDSSLDYVLFKSSSSIFVDGNTGLSYNNIFDAQLDVLHFALAHRNFSRMKIIVTETGWPTRGSPYASIDNAQTYNTNLIRHVMDGPGTPAWPHEELVVYIFSLFNENLNQGPETERNFGIFYPDMTSVYNLGFPDKGGRSWCIASSQALDSDLQYLLIWACILGKANCSAIQPGQQCFEPDTLFSHTSFAFNNYYQKNGATDDACNFGGAGIKVYTDPSYGKCIYHSCNTTTVAAATSFLRRVWGVHMDIAS